jgi:hypothetical protein
MAIEALRGQEGWQPKPPMLGDQQIFDGGAALAEINVGNVVGSIDGFESVGIVLGRHFMVN